MERGSRPHVTLTYAQSLDGSIAARRGEPLAISGPEALKMTHQLRAEHDAILVGIGTVLADDPQLTVRLVPGENPQPVILDSQLRFPLKSRLMGNSKKPWIVTTSGAFSLPGFEMDSAREEKQTLLESGGAKVFEVPPTPSGHVALPAMLTLLSTMGIRTLMLEGGAQIIGAFLTARLVDEIVLTIAPYFIGGLRALEIPTQPFPRLVEPNLELCGQDWLVRGKLAYDEIEDVS